MSDGDIRHATQRLREPAAWGLLLAATIIVINGFVVLLNSHDGFVPFALRAASAVGILVHPVTVGLVVLAVVLATHIGPLTPQARLVTLGGAAVLAVAIVLALIGWFAAFAADHGQAQNSVVPPVQIDLAGKVTGTFFGLAYLIVAVVAALFVMLTASKMLAGNRASQATAPATGAWGGHDQGQWQYSDQGGYPTPQQQPFDGQADGSQHDWGTPEPTDGQQWQQPQYDDNPDNQQWQQPQRPEGQDGPAHP